jgi:hypothetical protein
MWVDREGFEILQTFPSMLGPPDRKEDILKDKRVWLE